MKECWTNLVAKKHNYAMSPTFSIHGSFKMCGLKMYFVNFDKLISTSNSYCHWSVCCNKSGSFLTISFKIVYFFKLWLLYNVCCRIWTSLIQHCCEAFNHTSNHSQQPSLYQASTQHILGTNCMELASKCHGACKFFSKTYEWLMVPAKSYGIPL